MKKVFLFCAVVATTAVMVSCGPKNTTETTIEDTTAISIDTVAAAKCTADTTKACCAAAAADTTAKAECHAK